MAIVLTAPRHSGFNPAVGVLIIMVSRLCETLDGMAAKAMDRRSIYGTFLDPTADRVAEFLYLPGFWVLCVVHGGGVIPDQRASPGLTRGDHEPGNARRVPDLLGNFSLDVAG